jgi:single-strand DNA-binding protein
MTAAVADRPTTAHRNEVLLTGRLAAEPEERELPSGDVVVSFRVVVARPADQRGPTERSPSVDTLDCSAWSAGAQRTARSWQVDDVVEVTGALRRRFWRAGAAVASKTEVEMIRGRRVARPKG